MSVATDAAAAASTVLQLRFIDAAAALAAPAGPAVGAAAAAAAADLRCFFPGSGATRPLLSAGRFEVLPGPRPFPSTCAPRAETPLKRL